MDGRDILVVTEGTFYFGDLVISAAPILATWGSSCPPKPSMLACNVLPCGVLLTGLSALRQARRRIGYALGEPTAAARYPT